MKPKTKINQGSNGITLIALVITIIVLLILAAVSIATLTGENGILTKASVAKKQTQIEKEKENIRLAVLADKINETGGAVTQEGLQNELNKLNANATVTEEVGVWTKLNKVSTICMFTKICI